MKLCPFCGGKGYLCKQKREPNAPIIKITDPIKERELDQDWEFNREQFAYFITCRSCATQGPWAKGVGKDGFKGGAIGWWNMRQKQTTSDGYDVLNHFLTLFKIS